MSFSSEAFLRLLYELHCSSEEEVLNFHEYADREGVDRETVARVFYELREKELVGSPYVGPTAQISIAGIRFVEENGLADAALIDHQQSFRTQYLDILATHRDEYGPNRFVDCIGILSERGLSEDDLRRNIEYLQENGLLEVGAARLVKITPYGYDIIAKWRERVGTLEQFRQLQAGNIAPQARGHKLERLIEEAAKREGWGVERNVKRPGEEVDIILYQGFNYFIVSAKWEKSAVEVDAIRDLRERISQRPTSRGVLVSMSGFSKHATDYARERLESAVILLFGPQDIEKALTGQLTELLGKKLHGAMTTRTVEWE